jgi:hypothetical protein
MSLDHESEVQLTGGGEFELPNLVCE